MASYASLAQFKQRFAISSSDTARDDDIDLILAFASRLIEKKCNRVFEAATTATADRYFTAQDYRRVYIDDCTTITALQTDDDGDGTIETTWAATDYVTLPASSQFGTPYTWLEIAPEGDYRFPKGLRSGVKITATWGWTAVPDEIREACLMLANRYWQRRSAAFGVQGANEFGTPVVINKIDGDIEALLTPFVRYV